MQIEVVPNPEEVRELKKLRHNPVLVRYFERCLADSQNKLVRCEDATAIRVLQGYGRAFDQQIKHITED